MAIVTDESTRFPIPHEPDEWMMLKRLSAVQMDIADQAGTAKVMERIAPIMAALGPDAPKQALADVAEADPDDIKTRRAAYDPETLINMALTGWSYDEEVEYATVSQLDTATRDWLWDTIVQENTRPPAPAPGGEPS